MKRIKIVGLCLVAVFALSAMIAASGAQAGTYKICIEQKKGFYGNSTCSGEKVEKKGKPKGTWELIPLSTCIPQKHGFYSDSGCSVLDEKKGKGKGSFEKTKGLKFKDAGGPAKLATPGLGPNDVECTSSTSEGAFTGAKTATDRVKFVGCTFSGLPCQSAGPRGTASGESGVITTNLLDANLLDEGEKGNGGKDTVAPGEVWNQLVSSEHEPYQAEFECSGVVFIKTGGSIAGKVVSALNSLTTSQEQEFEVGVGEGALTTEASEHGFGGSGLSEYYEQPGTVNIWSPALPSEEHAGTATITTERPVGTFD
jgi:hypothetical protein